jgi:hypothetical protein
MIPAKRDGTLISQAALPGKDAWGILWTKYTVESVKIMTLLGMMILKKTDIRMFRAESHPG